MNNTDTLKLALEALESCSGAPHWEELQLTVTAIKQALAAQPAPTVQSAERGEPVEWIDSVMEQAQVFASAWSLVGSRFDFGSGFEEAEQAEAELRAMLATPPAAHGITKGQP